MSIGTTSSLSVNHLLLLNSIPGMIAYTDSDHRFQFVNRAYADWLGKDAASINGKLVNEVLGEAEFQKVKKCIEGALAGKPQHFTIDRKNKAGIRSLDISYTPDADEDGNIKGYTVFINDITEKKNVERELERKKNELQDYLDNASIGLHWVNGDGIITWANKAELDMLGYTLEEYIGHHISEFHACPDMITSILQRLEKNETLNNQEAVLRCKDGSKRNVIINSNVLWEDEKFVHTRCFTIDVTERKKLFDALTQSEAQHRELIEGLPAAVYTCDKNGYITLFNETAKELWGREPELEKEMWCGSWKIYKANGEFIPPDECPMAITIREKRPVMGEEIIIERPDGTRKNVLPHPRPIFDTHGNLTGAINMLVDITEQKVSGMALYESEERFRKMADNIPMLIWFKDENKNPTYVNQTFLDFLGIEKMTDFVKGTWAAHTHPEDRELYDTCFDEAFRLHIPYSIETRVKQTQTGQYRWFLSKGVPRYHLNNEFAGFLISAIDIHERKEAEHAIKESINNIHFLADAMPQKVWTASPEGIITYMNQPWIDYSGVTLEEFREKGWPIIIHPEEQEECTKRWLYSVHTGKDFEMEHRFKSKDGEYRWHLSRSIPQKNEHGKILLWVGTDTDIDDKKKAEEELILANRIAEYSLVKRDKALRELMETKKQVEQMMRVKEEFLSNMSHEIRTPMNAIVGFTDLILKTGLTTDQKQYTDAIKTSGENLLVIINDILDFSKLQAGAITFEKIDFRLSQMLSMLTDMMLPKSIEKDIKLSIAIDKNIPDQLIGDPTRLNQVLLNLVGNAIKFTEKGEIITSVELAKEDEKNVVLKFSVTDTGIGIPEEKISTIFEAFTQATSDTTRKYGGSGLGLSIVRQFVEKQGGQIFVESKVGVGSKFSFTLEFGKNQKQETPAKHLFAHDEHDTLRIQGLKVLLVEDNELNQILATKVMSDWKWNVELAENGLVAVEKIRQHDFDIILMDIQLPEMDGYEATRTIRSNLNAPKCYVPIMAMTAHAMPTEEKKCYAAGMDAYISKPFLPKVLYSKIVSLLNLHAEPVSDSSGKKIADAKK